MNVLLVLYFPYSISAKLAVKVVSNTTRHFCNYAAWSGLIALCSRYDRGKSPEADGSDGEFSLATHTIKPNTE